jgi:hypothetical protein
MGVEVMQWVRLPVASLGRCSVRLQLMFDHHLYAGLARVGVCSMGAGFPCCKRGGRPGRGREQPEARIWHKRAWGAVLGEIFRG